MTEVQTLTVAIEVIAVLGVTVQSLLVWDRMQGLNKLRRSPSPRLLERVTLIDIRTEVAGLLVFMLFLVIGVVVHITQFRGDPPFNPLERWSLENVALVFRYCFIAIMVLLLTTGIWKWVDWRRLTK
jgi:uncharacterized BrkB/YihY/UPF0761 family membrane protein